MYWRNGDRVSGTMRGDTIAGGRTWIRATSRYKIEAAMWEI